MACLESLTLLSYSAMNPLHSVHIARRRKQSFVKSAHGSMKVCTLGIQQGSDQQEPMEQFGCAPYL